MSLFTDLKEVLTPYANRIKGLRTDLDSLEPGLSDDAKIALLACFRNSAWVVDNGQDYYNTLEKALNIPKNHSNYLDEWTIFKTRTDGTITHNNSKIVFKLNTQDAANSYGFSVADTNGPAFSDLNGKKIKISVKAYSPNWIGEKSTSAPRNCVSWGIALYDNTANPYTRLRWRVLKDTALTNDEVTYTNIFDVSEGAFTAGTGVITNSSRIGIYFYSYTTNEVYLTSVRVTEVSG